MYKYLAVLVIVLVLGFEALAQAQSLKEFDSLRNYLKTKERFKIKPTVDCYTVDTCYIKYSEFQLMSIRAISEKDQKKFVSDNDAFSIQTLSNNKSELSISNLEFPEYEFSDYYLIENKLYVINTIPFCTGIACKYRYVQIFDLEDKIVYEKKIKWDN